MPPDFELVPDTTAVPSILAEHIDGPYRFAHYAFVPYVKVGAMPGTSMTLKHGARLYLAADQTRVVKGQETVDFAVLRQGGGVVLKEVISEEERERANALLAQFDRKNTHGFTYRPGGTPFEVPQAPKPQRRVAPRIRHRPDPGDTPGPGSIRQGPASDGAREVSEGEDFSGRPASPSPVPRTKVMTRVDPTPAVPEVTIPAHLSAFCAEHDVDPTQRDYVVIPKAEVAKYQPLPPWVIPSRHVQSVQVVKPRLRSDDAVEMPKA